MKTFLIFSTLLGSITAASAQDINGIWHQVSPGVITELGAPALRTEHFTAFSTSETGLRDYLATAPADPGQAIRIALPGPDGVYRTFRLWSTPVMEPALAAKYPGIRTYTAEQVGNTRVTAKIDYTSYGFHAMVFDGTNTYLINPYAQRPDGFYVVSYKHDISRPDGQYMSCEVGDDAAETPKKEELAERVNGTTRKTYRLAVSCTGEYAVAVAGANPSKANVLAKMVTTVNRVNGVYERELAVTMNLVAGNDTLIYLDGNTDPFSNNSSGSLLTENTTTINTRIGTANYDIGHVFSTGGGGLAGLGVVCSSSKARGVTGSSSPQGDSYDIDYVAHEVGHQFGANHTFNASTGSCSGNGATNSAFEPGSGSTIMAYAGICTGNNIQNNSSDYFHSVSLEQISNYITLPNQGATCAATTVSPNTNAVMPLFAATYVIPSGTPFELTAPAATDVTSDTAINYCWEERDLGNFGGSLASTTSQGPLFRSFPAEASRTRVFPTLMRLLAGVSSYAGEKLPTVSRTMSFGVTQRDMFQGWGCFNFPDDRITLQVEAMNPFRVTYPQGGEVWTGNDFQTITWDASNTTAAPVSCASVDILMSDDGGYTYPYTLATATPNDGSQRVLIPNMNNTDYVRIKVKGSGNVFFAISPSETYLVRGTVGVASAPASETVRFSPVPAHESLRISIPASLGKVDLRLMNTLGQTVWTGSLNGEQVLDAGNWPRGVYQMSMSNGKGFQQTRKLVLE